MDRSYHRIFCKRNMTRHTNMIIIDHSTFWFVFSYHPKYILRLPSARGSSRYNARFQSLNPKDGVTSFSDPPLPCGSKNSYKYELSSELYNYLFLGTCICFRKLSPHSYNTKYGLPSSVVSRRDIKVTLTVLLSQRNLERDYI